ncbi:hypothetical protein D3C81_1794240 [compost metagenome]
MGPLGTNEQRHAGGDVTGPAHSLLVGWMVDRIRCQWIHEPDRWVSHMGEVVRCVQRGALSSCQLGNQCDGPVVVCV